MTKTDKIAELETRIEIAERMISDMGLGVQIEYLDYLKTWGADSKQVRRDVYRQIRQIRTL